MLWLALRAALLAATLLPGLHAQLDPGLVFGRARAKIIENIERLPNHTCVQRVERRVYQRLDGKRMKRCAHVYEARNQIRLSLASRDRFELDVTVAGGAEIFSWAGAPEFRSSDAQEIVGGGVIGTGDYGRFLMSVFASDAAKRKFLGLRKGRRGSYAVWSYQVPESRSRYQIQVSGRSGGFVTLAYEGEIWIDAESAELRRLTIVVPKPPKKVDTCRLETSIDYQVAEFAGKRLLLPGLTQLKLWEADGTRYENDTRYSGCKAFQSESVFRPEVEAEGESNAPSAESGAMVRIPTGQAVRLKLQTRIDEEDGFAGQVIQAQLVDAIAGPDGAVIAPEGALVRGRIVRFERRYRPTSYFVLGLQFDTVVVGGREIPLRLELLQRSRAERLLNTERERREGIGLLFFQNDPLTLDQRFVMDWITVGG